MKTKVGSRTLAPILLILFLAAFLRLGALERQPLRGDEAFILLNYAERPLSESLRYISPLDPLPPGVSGLYRAWWLAVGPGGVWLLRLVPALSNFIGVAAVYALGRNLANRRVAGLAMIIWAIHPYLIWHAQDARNYATWSGLSALALVFGLRLLARPRAWRAWASYALAALAALAFAYPEVAMLLAFTLYVLGGRRGDVIFRRRFFALTLFLGVLLALVFLWLQSGLFFSGGYGGNLSFFSLSELWVELPQRLVFGESLPFNAPWLGPLLVFGTLGAAALIGHDRRHRQTLWLSGALIIVPIVLMALAGLFLRVFHARYVLASVTGLVLLMAVALDVLARRRRRWALGSAAILFSLMALSLANYYGPYQKAVDWRVLVDWLIEPLRPEDVVIQQSVDPAFSKQLAWAGSVAEEWALPAAAAQSEAAITAQLSLAAEQKETIWTVGRAYADWPNATVVDDWLLSARALWLRGEIGGIPYAAYLPNQPTSTELAGASALHGATVFGEPPLAQLRAHHWLATRDALILRLYWQTLAQSEVPLKVFVHLSRPGEKRPLAQADRAPAPATTEWVLDLVQREIYRLEMRDIAPGEYDLRVGWYEEASGERLLMNGADSFFLTRVRWP